ncbi:hypothetical protein M3Y94_00046300 [Aphelenchoides besseyi]|nr:hypothetical protein M3Y94_00046300 [Aphelenchoides besseyi]
MSTMLIVGLLIAPILVVFVDAGSWKLHIQEVKRVQRNNTLGVLHDIYREVLNFDRTKYRGSGILWVPKKGCKATGIASRVNTSMIPENLPQLKILIYLFVLRTFGEKLHLEEKVTFGVGEEMRNRDQVLKVDREFLGLEMQLIHVSAAAQFYTKLGVKKAIDAPIFTMYLRKCPDSEDCENRGIITIGSYDKEMCGDVVGDAKADPKFGQGTNL